MVSSVEILDKKKDKIKEWEKATYELLDATIKYKKKQNELWLYTDFAEELGKGRPTVDEKKAYISNKTIDLKEKKDSAYNKVKLIELELELLDDELVYHE